MNEKIYIQRKYNKCINILLAIYVVLCLVLSLLFNGFFVKSRAYSYGDNMSNIILSGSFTGSSSGQFSSKISYIPAENNRGVFVSIDELDDIVENAQAAYLGYTSVSGYVFLRMRDNSSDDFSALSETDFNGDVVAHLSNTVPITSDYITFMTSNGFSNENLPNISLIYGSTMGWGVSTVKLEGDIQYIDNVSDLKKFFINKDDSVVKIGDPTQPILTQDGNLPTPQKVNIWDSAQNCAGLTWDNPKSINKYIKDLGDNVGIEIEWKPSIALVLDMLTIDSLTSSEWLPVYKGVISKSGSLINAFVSKKNDNARLDNNLNGYNYEIDDKFIFTPLINDNDYLEQIAKNNHQRLWYANEDNVKGGSLNDSELKKFKKNNLSDDNTNVLKSNRDVVGGEAETTPGEEGVNVAPSGISKLDLIQGIITGVGYVGKMIFNSFQIDTSNYRVRYYVKDGNNYTVSNWVDAKRGYDTNENAKEPTNINFTDSNDNPVSNPTYLPANQVTSSDSNSNSWWDRFYSENNNVLSNLQTAFANFTADSGDFFSFFRALFTEFPEFYIFLCMGLGLAIMLRILGR